MVEAQVGSHIWVPSAGIRFREQFFIHNLGVFMRYCIRTITWRFKESIELDLPAKRSIINLITCRCFENYQSLFKNQVRERFVVSWLNSANKVIGL